MYEATDNGKDLGMMEAKSGLLKVIGRFLGIALLVLLGITLVVAVIG